MSCCRRRFATSVPIWRILSTCQGTNVWFYYLSHFSSSPNILKFHLSVCREFPNLGVCLRVGLSADLKMSAVSGQLPACQALSSFVCQSVGEALTLPITDGTICRAGIRSGTLSADTQLMRERRYARPPPPDLTYSFCCGLAIQSAPDY